MPVPEGLDLDTSINPSAFTSLVQFQMEGMPKNTETARVCFTHIYLQPDPEDEAIESIISKHSSDDFKALGMAGGGSGRHHTQEYSGYQVDAESDRQRWQSTPFYLQSSSQPPVHPDEVDIDSIPVIRLTEEDLKGKKHRKHRRKGEAGDGRHHQQRSSGSNTAVMMKEELMPEGARDSGSEGETSK